LLRALRSRLAADGVAIDDGAVGLALVFESHDGFDAGAHGGGSTLVRTARDQVIEVREERLGQSYSNLLCSLHRSVPPRYA